MKELVRRALLLLASVLVMLALGELGLRFFAPVPYSMNVVYKADGHVGERLHRFQTYRLADGGTVTINSHGFRGAEFEEEKPSGVVRIVALGGSSTFSYQTGDAAIWTRRLQDLLRADFGPGVEVLNGGTPGYTVFDSKVNYLYRIRDLSPDALIVYHTWNDLKLFRTIERKGMPSRTPYRVIHPVRSWLRQFQLAWRLRALVQGNGALPPRETVVPDDERAGPEKIESGGRAHLWEQQNFDDLALWARNDGVLPVFASQAGLLAPETIDDEAVRSVVYAEYVGLSYEEILRNWLAVREIVRASAARHDALFVDVYAAVPHTREYLHDHVHLTRSGNEAVARAFYAALQSDSRFRALFD